jgi:hypothetical protein
MMNPIRVLATAMLFGCGLPPGAVIPPVSVQVRSHNRSSMEVYLLCGDHDARLLGGVRPHEGAIFEFPSALTRCVAGLNFFLVDRTRNHGSWVGPLHPQGGSIIDLVIEKSAALSSASVSGQLPLGFSHRD